MQIWVIHGGETFSTYERFINHLREVVLDISKFNKHGWKSRLQGNLGDMHEVLLPKMPNPDNAKYIEWKIWFEKFIPYVQGGAVLIGSSLGGVFLAKYLAEEAFPKKIKAVFLVAPPYDDNNNPDLADFAPPKNLGKFIQQSGHIFLYHSKDDPVVAFAELAKYQRALPNATVRIFEDRGHFNQKVFPELAQDIKSL